MIISPSAGTSSAAQDLTPSHESRTTRQTQMNVRMDASQKADGDSAVAQAGYTPSSAVRALWAFAATHANTPQDITSLLESAESAAKNESISRITHRMALVEEGPRTVASFARQFKTHPSTSPERRASYDDLLFDALTKRMRERGTL